MSNKNDIPKWEDSEEIIPRWDETEPMEQAPSEFSPAELAKTTGGMVLGYGAGKVASPLINPLIEKAAEKTIDPLAELLAYRGAGGYSGTEAGKELNAAMVVKKAGDAVRGVDRFKDAGVFDEGVTPRSVGREILEKKLLGRGGLGFKSQNSVRALENVFKTNKPTNEILEQIDNYPIHRESILDRTKELINQKDMDLMSRQNRDIDKELRKLEKLKEIFTGVISPLKAEEVKRELQQSVDYSNNNVKAKSVVDKAEAQATKEMVENAVEKSLGKEGLSEFRRRKVQSGSAGVASDLLKEVYEKSQNRLGGWQGLLGTALNYAQEKGAGVLGAGLDMGSKVIKKAAPGVGAFVGGTVGALAEEAVDTPELGGKLEQEAFERELSERKRRDEAAKQFPGQEDQLQKFYKQLDEGGTKVSPADTINPRAQYLQSALDSVDPAFRQGYAYKQAEQELKQLTAPAGQKLITDSKSFKDKSPDELMELSQQFQNIKGADKFVAPLENAAQASSEEERQARLFGLYQQPAFRQLLKKGKEEN